MMLTWNKVFCSRNKHKQEDLEGPLKGELTGFADWMNAGVEEKESKRFPRFFGLRTDCHLLKWTMGRSMFKGGYWVFYCDSHEF